MRPVSFFSSRISAKRRWGVSSSCSSRDRVRRMAVRGVRSWWEISAMASASRTRSSCCRWAFSPQPHRHLPDLAAEDGQFSLLLLGQHLLLLPVENAVNVPAHALQFPVAPPGGAVPDGPADRPQPQRQQAADGIQQGRCHGAHRCGQQQPQSRPPHLRVLPDAHASTM